MLSRAFQKLRVNVFSFLLHFLGSAWNNLDEEMRYFGMPNAECRMVEASNWLLEAPHICLDITMNNQALHKNSRPRYEHQRYVPLLRSS